MKPYVGGMVLYRSELSEDVTEHPAIITRVYSDNLVNLVVFLNGGNPVKKMNVTLNPDEKDNATNVWRWPSIVPSLMSLDDALYPKETEVGLDNEFDRNKETTDKELKEKLRLIEEAKKRSEENKSSKIGPK